MTFTKALFAALVAGPLVASAALAADAPGSLAGNVTQTLTVEVQAGLRSARFHAAPQTFDLWTQELVASVRSGDLAAVGPVAVQVGASFALSQMRGDLGPGLTSFSGYRAGPDARLVTRPTASLPSLRVFGSVAYLFGDFTGQGSPNWDVNQAPTMFLRGSETLAEEEKTYRTGGPHFALGTTYDVAAKVAVSAVYDYGVETMINDSTIISAGEEVSGRDRTTSTSRSFLLGGIFAL
jgi:hypothetical protein